MDISASNSFVTNYYNNYQTASEEIIDRHALFITKTVTRRENFPWMDEEFKTNRRTRRKLEKKWKNQKTEENRLNYVAQRKLCAEMSVAKQESYYSWIVEKAGNNQKTLFKVVNNLLDKEKVSTLPEHTDSLKLADEFNDYYTKKVDNLKT